ncbi:hypothetical protein ACFFGH_03770 [Lysobacter korlensis]|uniref:Glycosyltransferase RgtA/B/C/D-like domain-containing protein n=1 Tax=Lysobacter korlensis TaxID=553636 RepID=A0ABV6RJ06_9GAMM
MTKSFARMPPPSTMRLTLAWLVAAVAYVALTLVFGRDVNWDLLNYHDYLAFTSTGDRLDRDFFPAGIQSYQNPLIYAPFEALLRSGLNSAGIGVGLALIHSANALLLMLICMELARSLPPEQRRLLIPGFLLGATSPIFLSHLGSTFVDPTASVAVLASVWLLLRREHWTLALAAAGLAGFAAGLKLTNIAFAAALGLTLAICRRPYGWRWAWETAAAAAAMVIGFLVAYAHWGAILSSELGNPIFPLLNGAFKSPLFAPYDGNIVRFIPQEPADLLAFPFRILQHNSWIYVEVAAPDLLPAAVSVLAAASLLIYVARRSPAKVADAQPSASPERFWVFLAAAALTWLATSSNGRYALPLFMLLGPAFALLVGRLFPLKAAGIAAVVALVLQWFNTYSAGVERWGAQRWTEAWIPVELPRQHRSLPGAYVSLDAQSQSYLVRHLHPDSTYINLIGSHHSIPSQGPAFARFQRLLMRHPERAFAVFKEAPLPGTRPSVRTMAEQKSALLDRVGLRIDASSCSIVRIDNAKPLPGKLIEVVNRQLPPQRSRRIFICRLTPAPPSPDLKQRRNAASAVMTTLEARCPDLFYPPGPQTEGLGTQWYRSYTKYDNVLVSVHLEDRTVRYWLTGQGKVKVIGRLDSWARDLATFDCSLPERGRRGVASITTLHDMGPL